MFPITQVGTATDTGRVRSHNEDYLDCREPETTEQREAQGLLYVLADGMGGHNAGEVASRLAVETVLDEYYRESAGDVEADLRRAIELANARIYERGQVSKGEAGMGTTVVTVVVRGNELYVGHVGDSRAYRARGEQIFQLPTDHSWVAEQAAKDALAPTDVLTHPYRNLLTRALGYEEEVEVEINRWSLEQGDILILCSDGLTDPVGDELIRETVSLYEPQEACTELVRLANERGGPDNVSVIVVKVLETGGSEEQADATLLPRQVSPLSETASARSVPTARIAESGRRDQMIRWLLALLTGLGLGLGLGLLIGWVLWPTPRAKIGFTDLVPQQRKQVLVMAARLHERNRDLDSVVKVLEQFGSAETVSSELEELASETARSADERAELQALARAVRTSLGVAPPTQDVPDSAVTEPPPAGSDGLRWLCWSGTAVLVVALMAVLVANRDRIRGRRREHRRP